MKVADPGDRQRCHRQHQVLGKPCDGDSVRSRGAERGSDLPRHAEPHDEQHRQPELRDRIHHDRPDQCERALALAATKPAYHPESDADQRGEHDARTDQQQSPWQRVADGLGHLATVGERRTEIKGDHALEVVEELDPDRIAEAVLGRDLGTLLSGQPR